MIENYLELLFAMYENGDEQTKRTACRICINSVITKIERRIQVSEIEYMPKYYALWERSYMLAGRRSLEHFIDYMEMDKETRVLDTIRGVLKPFVYYLNKIAFDPVLKYIIASYPPSTGKSFCLNYYSAWIFGLSIDNSILRLSYSDDLVTGFSRSIKALLTSNRFSEVFPLYKLYNGKPFEKQAEDDWKIKNARPISSHMAKSRDGQITGKRANKAIIFDDMTKGASEATNSTLHQSLYTQWKTEWFNRKDGASTDFIFAGTMWSPEDILNRVTEERESISPAIPSEKFKYVWESEDGSTVYIRVPLLDENDETTCPAVMSSVEARQLRDSLDEFSWACVYQQQPIAPTGLEFSDEYLQHYEQEPLNEDGSSKWTNFAFAVLDPARKGKDNVSMPICKSDGEYYYMIDCIFKQKAMTDLYDLIIEKIIEHNITKLVIENNIDTSLKTLLNEKLHAKGYYLCEIIEKYNTANKEARIRDARGIIKKQMIFKDKKNYKRNTDYGRFMTNFTTYSFDYANKHDDAPDSLAMFVNEIILDKSRLNKIKGIDRRLLGI